MNKSMKQKQTHRHREQTCSCQAGEGVGEGRIGSLGLADANYYIENGLNNKVLQYSTGNCIQYPLINHNGKEKKRLYTYV